MKKLCRKFLVNYVSANVRVGIRRRIVTIEVEQACIRPVVPITTNIQHAVH